MCRLTWIVFCIQPACGDKAGIVEQEGGGSESFLPCSTIRPLPQIPDADSSNSLEDSIQYLWAHMSICICLTFKVAKPTEYSEKQEIGDTDIGIGMGIDTD